jgi:tRNA nucleotidyltransferase/poly(A) polymerase
MFSNTLLELFLHIKPHTTDSYIVGGCVRDICLGKKPKDFDVVIDCDPSLFVDDLKLNGWKVTEAGQNFLVTIASKNGEQFEIARYRKDGEYIDGRHPESVEVGDIHTDSVRRDITINALYMDPFTEQIIDPTKMGLKDLQSKVIRMNGRAEDRIKEDLLRIMRVYRFANQLGFEIESKTLKACRKYFAEMQSKIPAERIKNEIEKMCL